MNKYKRLFQSAVKPYSALLFLNNKFAGILLLAITFMNPSVAISGVLSVLFTIVFAEFLDFKEAYLAQGFYIYNSLLVGLGIGFIFSPSFISILLIAISSALTFMFSYMLNRLFSVYKIPTLSLPFSIVTMFVYLASLKYSGLLTTLVNNATLFDIQLPLIGSGFLKSLGTIFFLPSNITGILILLLIFYFSRIMFIMAIVGYYFGVLVHSYFIGSYIQALYDPYAFNYILVAISLCGIFLLPTVKNFILALMGVSISVVLTDAFSIFFNYYSIPVFTLPFNITVIVFIFILSTIYYKEFNLEIKSTPEKSLSNYLSKIFRFGDYSPKISLPFSGEWSVYQAFDDQWTHKGEYKYAYDFVIKKENKTHANDGVFVEDYYAFGQSILSPVNGYVVDARSDLKDNRIGEVDSLNNWGNYIIIRSDLGFFVEISHLRQHSMAINIGDYIQENSVIAQCGNSGYSPEPHIHIQVQNRGIIGGFTTPFSFNTYIQQERLLFNSIPKKDDIIKSVINDKSISSSFLFVLDDELRYDVFKDSKKIDNLLLTVKMNELGAFYFEDRQNNRLYFYNDLKQFYFYNYVGDESYLKWFFILAPRIPFVSSQKVVYSDFLPLYLIKNRFKTLLIELLSAIKKEAYKKEFRYKFDGTNISSEMGLAVINRQYKGYTKMIYKDTIELRRVV